MAGLSTDMQTRVLKALVGELALVEPTVWYVELNTATDPTDTAATANATATDQTTQAVQVTAWNAVSGAPAATANTNAVAFDMTGATDTAASSFTVWNHATTRTDAFYLGSGALSGAPISFVATDTLTFAAGDLDWTVE